MDGVFELEHQGFHDKGAASCDTACTPRALTIEVLAFALCLGPRVCTLFCRPVWVKKPMTCYEKCERATRQCKMASCYCEGRTCSSIAMLVWPGCWVSSCIAHDEVVVLLTPAASTKPLARILKEEWICISTGSGYHAVSTCTLTERTADVFEIVLMEIATSQARRASSGRCCNGYTSKYILWSLVPSEKPRGDSVRSGKHRLLCSRAPPLKVELGVWYFC